MGSMGLKVDEPSMEDILASIRRIISDDQSSAHETDVHEPELSPLRAVLDIAERHVASSRSAEPLPQADDEYSLTQDDPFGEERSIASHGESHEEQELVRPVGSAAVRPAQTLAQPCERSPGEAMMSRMTEDVISEAFGRLNVVRAVSQSPTVEDLMRDMLRPMLKAWLDENLPSLVERLVQAEIERVTRR